ncbi:MAG: hypothetical protein ACLRWM_05505 [Streptococcus sp.]
MQKGELEIIGNIKLINRNNSCVGIDTINKANSGHQDGIRIKTPAIYTLLLRKWILSQTIKMV